MSADAGIGGNLLLGVPGQVLHQILAFYDVHHMIRVLWLTGSKALQARMRRCTSAVRLEAEARPRTAKNENELQKIALPACLAEFSQLEALVVYASSQSVVVDCIDVLKKINPGLRRLDLSVPDDQRIFKPRVPLPAPEVHQGDESGPDVDELLIDLSVTFPHLEALSFRSGDIDICLPPGLRYFMCYWMMEDDELSDFISHLPAGLREIDCSSPYPPFLEAHLLAMLPSSLTFLGVGYNIDSLEEYEALPRSITSLGGATRLWNESIAQVIPPGMLTLTLELDDESVPLAPFPPMLTALSIDGVALLPADLRQLPRTLLHLYCTIELVELSIETDHLPPNLKDLSVRLTNDDDSLEDTEDLNKLAIILPQSLESLRLLNSTPHSQFYGLLPKGLQTLFSKAKRCKIDPNQFSLPSRLSSLTITKVLRRSDKPLPAEELKDMDSWTKQDSLDIASGLLVLSHAPEDTLKPFPFHILPRTLTLLRYMQRPTPISALQFLPLLLELNVLKFVEDAKYDPADSVLVSKANELRQFGESLSTRSQLALNPLTRVCALDLLPRSLKSLQIFQFDSDITKKEWRERFPSLRILQVGVSHYQLRKD